MRRTSHDGAFLIVEGNDDVRFWRSRRHVMCELVDGEGKTNVIGAIRRVDETRFGGALGIVDDDGDVLYNARVESDNLLYTDARDLDCLLCRSRALDRVLAEHGDPEKIRRFKNDEDTDVRTAILERAVIFGRLRLAVHRTHQLAKHRAQPATKIPKNVDRFLKEITWKVDEEALFSYVFNDAVPDSLRDDVRANLRELAQRPKMDPWYVAHGHDLVAILRAGLRQVLGDLPTRIKNDDIAGFLRVAMAPDDLRHTGLCTGLLAWQAANQPYTILAD